MCLLSYPAYVWLGHFSPTGIIYSPRQALYCLWERSLHNFKCLELLWYQSIRSHWPFNVAVLIWIVHSGLWDDTLVWLTNSNTILRVNMYMSVIYILDKYTHTYIYIYEYLRDGLRNSWNRWKSWVGYRFTILVKHDVANSAAIVKKKYRSHVEVNKRYSQADHWVYNMIDLQKFCVSMYPPKQEMSVTVFLRNNIIND